MLIHELVYKNFIDTCNYYCYYSLRITNEKQMLINVSKDKVMSIIEHSLYPQQVIEYPNVIFKYDSNEIYSPYHCFVLHSFFLPLEVVFAEACPLTCSVDYRQHQKDFR